MLKPEQQNLRVAVQTNSGNREQYDKGYREWLVYAVLEIERLEVMSTRRLTLGVFRLGWRPSDSLEGPDHLDMSDRALVQSLPEEREWYSNG